MFLHIHQFPRNLLGSVVRESRIVIYKTLQIVFRRAFIISSIQLTFQNVDIIRHRKRRWSLGTWRTGRDSNPRPLPWQGSILTNWTTDPFYFLLHSNHPDNYRENYRSIPFLSRRQRYAFWFFGKKILWLAILNNEKWKIKTEQFLRTSEHSDFGPPTSYIRPLTSFSP